MRYQVMTMTSKEKGRIEVCLDNGEVFSLYRGEVKALELKEGSVFDEIFYQKILSELIGKRAIKRAMHLLERQERTEKQLREKLQQNGYPQICIDMAISYVKSYHYIDDLRYAKVYIRCHQEKESRQRLKTKLLMRGVSQSLIEQALEEEYEASERVQIEELLKKRSYDFEDADENTYRKTVQFLIRKGFKTSDIFSVMRQRELL